MSTSLKVPTRNVSVPAVVARALVRPDTAAALARFLGTVLKDFFALQFAVRLGLKKVSVTDVDHPLDEAIPFTPDRIGSYLDFIAFWIRPLGWIGQRFGARAFAHHSIQFLRLIERCYREAADVYRARMTTTRRPRYLRGRFLALHLFDPHLLCVPSLHVMVVVLSWTFGRRAFAELGVESAEAAALAEELFDGAVDITESVLLIKQHSVNCLPAALYAMTRITPPDVTPADVGAFIERLFTTTELDAAAEIRAHVSSVYERLVTEGQSDELWQTTVQRYVEDLGTPSVERC